MWIAFLHVAFYSHAQITDTSYARIDSLKKIIDSRDSISEENYLVDPSGILIKDFQIRLVNILNTQNSFYNGDLFRTDQAYRATVDFVQLHSWVKIYKRIDGGVTFNAKSLRVGEFDSAVLNVLEFKNERYAQASFRSIVPQFKILLIHKKWRVVYQTALVIPFYKSSSIDYKGDEIRDNNFWQWNHDLYFNRVYSANFTLNLTADADYHFKQEDTKSDLIVRPIITPIFNYNFTPKFKLTAFFDFSPTVSEGFFFSFYLREGAGLNYKPSSKLTVDVLYTYIAVGKRTQAVKSIIIGVRYNL